MVEPFYQELLRLRRLKGPNPAALMGGIKHQSRSFAGVVLDLLEVYRAMPTPRPKLTLVVSDMNPAGDVGANKMQAGYGSFEKFWELPSAGHLRADLSRLAHVAHPFMRMYAIGKAGGL
jgi:hypothetical protein